LWRGAGRHGDLLFFSKRLSIQRDPASRAVKILYQLVKR
jgi:hypothetical protein